ncbi:EpsG family protein, partial [Klebsiella pneumoniae]
MNNIKSISRILSPILLFIIIIILSIIACTREIGSDNDSIMYATIVQDSVNGFYNYLQKEPGFWLIVFLNNTFTGGSIEAFFFIYSFIALCLCFYGIYKVSPAPYISIIIYLAFFFIIHEMMQIRIAFAAGFIFFTFYYIVDNQRRKSFFISAIAVIFHYSTIISFFFFFLRPKRKITKIYLILPVLGMLFGLFINNAPSFSQAFFNLMPTFISYKAQLYFDLNTEGDLKRVTAVAMGFGSLIYYSLL